MYHGARFGEGPVLAVLAMLAEGCCAWLRVAALLSSPPLRAMAPDASGRDGKAGASAEPESPSEVVHLAGTGDISIWGKQGTFLFRVDSPRSLAALVPNRGRPNRGGRGAL